MDKEWNESDHPRKENGQFGKGGGGSVSNKKPSERHNRVKSRERKPLKVSDYEKTVLRDTVARHNFTNDKKAVGYAKRCTYNYLYTVQIDDANSLMYTPIKRKRYDGIRQYTQTPISKKLKELLEKVSTNEHFVNGVLITLNTDEQRKILIEELENGLDDKVL